MAIPLRYIATGEGHVGYKKTMELRKLFEKHSNDLEAIKSQIGKIVNSLSRDRYYFNGKPDDADAGSLEISFCDSTYLTLKSASDGESVHASLDALEITESFKIDDESHCSWERFILTDKIPWSKIKGTKLCSVDAIVDRLPSPNSYEILIGWVLHFEHVCFATYWNCGDEAKILYNELPPKEDEIETKIEKLF